MVVDMTYSEVLWSQNPKPESQQYLNRNLLGATLIISSLLCPPGYTSDKRERLQKWKQELFETESAEPRAEGLDKGGGIYANVVVAWEPGV